MSGAHGKVLVMLRSVLPDDVIAKWPSQEEFRLYESVSEWMYRSRAENSLEHVQPIPVATLRDRNERYCVIKRSRNAASGLSMKYTLVVGGHVDYGVAGGDIPGLLYETLVRELEEEAGITSCESITPFVTLLDRSSEESSRHLAFVYRATVDPESVRIRAPEEFSQRTKFKVTFMPLGDIQRLERRLDPWSGLLVDYMTGSEGAKSRERQYLLPSPLDVR